MSEDKINKIKEAASTVGSIIKLKDGTKLYCISGEQTVKVLKTGKFEDAELVEYAIDSMFLRRRITND